jgi:hypothetical protein
MIDRIDAQKIFVAPAQRERARVEFCTLPYEADH